MSKNLPSHLAETLLPDMRPGSSGHLHSVTKPSTDVTTSIRDVSPHHYALFSVHSGEDSRSTRYRYSIPPEQ